MNLTCMRGVQSSEGRADGRAFDQRACKGRAVAVHTPIGVPRAQRCLQVGVNVE